jgi:hypothetical protein
MTTPVSDVNDLFLARINDYRITTIFQSSGSLVMTQYLDPWILDAIDMFGGICTQSLAYTLTSGSVEGYFTEDLTTEHKNILSQIMVQFWLSKSVSDILQMNNSLQDSDFKTFSQAQNLTAKKDYLNNVKESVSQLLVNYGYKNNDWENWRNMKFDEV